MKIEQLERRMMMSISATNFTFEGSVATPVNQTGWEAGLAYRPSTDTFFTIGNAGRAPFDLDEIKIPDGGPATLVKDWGPIDPPGNPLDANGSLLSMKGLEWDDAGKLWISWGSYYNADHSNDECLAYITFAGNKINLHGPWGVPNNVGSDNIRGELQLAPAELKAITGQQFISFAGNGSTSQDESWGTSLSSFANPTSLPADSQTTAEELTHWPELDTKYANPNVGGALINDWHSDFPRMVGDTVTTIKGNENVIPGIRDSYQYNLTYSDSTFVEGDGIFGGTWIKEPGVDGLIYFGRESEGYRWYGNNAAHDDNSAAGISFDNNLGVVDSASTSRGNHATSWNWTVDFVNSTDVLNAAKKVVNGTATASDLEQVPSSIVDMTSLGGDVPLPKASAASIDGVYFDQKTSTLYVLESYGQILEWHVGKSTTTISQMKTDIVVSPTVDLPEKQSLTPTIIDSVMANAYATEQDDSWGL